MCKGLNCPWKYCAANIHGECNRPMVQLEALPPVELEKHGIRLRDQAATIYVEALVCPHFHVVSTEGG